MAKIVFEDLVFNTPPRERFVFNEDYQVELSIDDKDKNRLYFLFVLGTAFKYYPVITFDREPFVVDGIRRDTIIIIEDSIWVQEINREECEAGHPITHNLHHYLVPSDKGVYEIMAESVAKVESDK